MASVILMVAMATAAGDDASGSTDAVEMAARIDELLATTFVEENVEPAPLAGDAEFARRAYLDLTGVIPRVSEARKFLGDDRLDKRARLVDALLDSPARSTHLATTWRNIMLPGGVSAEQAQGVVGMQQWFRRQFARNLRYDRLVSEFLVASGAGQAGPAVFYAANEFEPEKLAAATSRVFLGVQIDCAQCHDHPFDNWKQPDFWGMAAFFARIRRGEESSPQMAAGVSDVEVGEVMLPDTDLTVNPRYLGGRKADESDGGTRRVQLAIWMASRDNPWLARAAVNRAWSHLFGRGIVEPVDDFGPHNQPSHPELLNELASYFARTSFDLKNLYRTLALTDAYQRTSRVPPTASQSISEEAPAEASQAGTVSLFARMAIKTLTPDQLYDSLSRSLLRENAVIQIGESSAFDPQRQAFIAKMQTPSRSAAEFEAGVLQALALLNGVETAEAADSVRGGLLQAVDAPWLKDANRVETLYLATLSRLPTEGERAACLKFIESKSDEESRRRALGDILWALLNSAEFALNH